ncbi:MAG TPA: ribose-5-phosphate isomerase RpiA [Planctomycetota bacterium]|nr:ribose-5-phosphate isomerase RpiA [Planctomycetota bacterium]
MSKQAGGADDPSVQAVVKQVLEMIKDGSKVGLGSGRASAAFIDELGKRVKAGLKITGVPTSEASSKQAKTLGIPLVELTEDLELDLTVDGADEVSPHLDMIKGWGGALVRERIVAEASKKQIILVGPEKLVDSLGSRGRIPVEVIPLAEGYVKRKLKSVGMIPTVRLDKDGKKPFITDNGCLTLDCKLETPLKDAKAARALEQKVLSFAGVVDTGMFLGTCEQVLVGNPDGTVKVLKRK